MPYLAKHMSDGSIVRIGYGRDKGKRDVIEYNTPPELDLVDEAEWEEHVPTISLEDAGLEEEELQPDFGGDGSYEEGIHAYLAWFYDGDYDKSLG